MALVGAMNVGSIKLHFDPQISTNKFTPILKKSEYIKNGEERFYKNGINVKKGEEIGYFTLGSTVVLIFEAKKNFKFLIKPQQKIKVGEKIGDYF